MYSKVSEIKIDAMDGNIYREIKTNWDHIAKPLDGLGDFETLLCKIGAIQRKTMPGIGKRGVVMMIADNGVVAEGVSQSGQEVTLAVAKAMGEHTSSVCRMAAVGNADPIPVDVGINSDEKLPGVYDAKVRKGTRDFLVEPAMTEAEAMAAINAGIQTVERLSKEGYEILATGEMGIGNTTTSTALASALLKDWKKDNTGRGAGLTDAGLNRKKEVIDLAFQKYDLMKASPMQALLAVGGLDIAGLCGVFIGGAIYHIPIIIDGLISGCAALLAEMLVPGCKDYMLPSHLGKEHLLAAVHERLGLSAIIHAGLALGEGTGAVMLFPLLDMAMALYSEGNDFDAIAVEQYERNK